MLKRVATLTAIILLFLGGALFFLKNTAWAPVGHATTSTQQPIRTATPAFDKTTYSTTDPASIWVVVNKQHRLNPASYIPANLVMPNVPLRVPGNESMQVRRVTAAALENMFTAAKTQNIGLMVASGYRSYAYQVNLYNGYVASMGQDAADQQSARPGFSEHQTGLAADLEPADRKCETEQCFADTPEGQWLAANAYKYGFIIRYQKGQEEITGYEDEPWHARYIGVDLATEMHKENALTLEQFFGIAGGKTYAK